MAEIKSTMDMVMERAARMAARATDKPNHEDNERQGMRFVTEYLKDPTIDLGKTLLDQPPEQQSAIRRGMTIALNRNILLPRDETLLETSEKALKGLISIEQGASDINAVCSEIQNILGQYDQHKQQIRQQLEDSVRAQIEQKLMQQGGNAANVKIDPTMQPQFQEEWARMESDLNGQYNDALDQRKELVLQRTVY